jgi:hypothetical protein
MTVTEAYRKALSEYMEAADVDEILAETKVEDLVFHDVEAVDARRFRVTVWVYGRKVATVWRRSESDAHASGIRVSHRFARLAA